MSTTAKGRPQAVPTDYDNVKLNELLEVYKQAYTEAGFILNKQTTHIEGAQADRNIINLGFEFVIREYPHKKKGVASLRVVSSDLTGQSCRPCSVYSVTFGVDFSDYSSEEYGRAIQEMNSARQKANDQIKIQLGKNIRPVKAYQGVPNDSGRIKY